MQKIIDKARIIYPNDGVQQFYRIIKEPLEEIMTNAVDLKNDSFENEGIFVVKWNSPVRVTPEAQCR